MKHPHASIRLAILLLALCALATSATPPLAQEFRHWNLSDTSEVPRTLSATGLYTDIAARRVIPSATPYEVNSALWSDGAAKQRWFILRPGKSIGFREKDDYWDYPDSTVFVKQFALDTLPGDSSSRVLWETRLLILDKQAPDPGDPSRKTDAWHGFSYKWRPDQSDADLVPDTGLRTTLRVWPEGRDRPSRLKKWVFPSRDACMRCHRSEQSGDTHARTVLGFFTAQLNRPSATSPGRNQLQDFFTRGLLTGTLPADLGKSPRWYGIDHVDDGKGPPVTAEMKARAYIAANCSGCHGMRGMQVGATFGVNIDYDYHTGVPAMSLEYRPVSWSFGMDTLPPLALDAREEWLWGPYLVTPRFPQKSALLFRQKVRNTEPVGSFSSFDSDRNQMPPMGTFEVDTAAMKVVEEWIAGIPSRAVPAGIAAVPHAASSPVLRGRELYLPPALLAGNPLVRLRGMDGRGHTLRNVGPGRYAIPSAVPRGVYVLQVGRRSFTRAVW